MNNMETPGDSQPESKEKQKNEIIFVSNHKIWLVAISFLLFLLVVSNIIQYYLTYQQNQIAAERAASYQERVESAQEILDLQQSIIFNLMENYQKDAYDNPNVERIAEQQLIATEYSLTALQIITIQNTQIIELLANMP